MGMQSTNSELFFGGFHCIKQALYCYPDLLTAHFCFKLSFGGSVCTLSWPGSLDNGIGIM